MIYFTSDLHLLHKNVIKYCYRPYSNINQHDNDIISNINNIVKPDDTLIIVGDVSIASKRQIRKVIQRIKCENIILVRGNHDNKSSLPRDCFTLVVDRLNMTINGQSVLICHYPYRFSWWRHWIHRLRYKSPRYRERRPRDNGEFLIHGHTHSNGKTIGRMLHVGVDAWDMKPVSQAKIEQLIAKQLQQEKNKRNWLLRKCKYLWQKIRFVRQK